MTARRRRTDSNSAELPLLQSPAEVSIPIFGILNNPPPIPAAVNNFLFATNSYLHKKTDAPFRNPVEHGAVGNTVRRETDSDEEMERRPSAASLANKSALRDRTREFKQIMQSARQRNMYQSVKKKPQPLQQYSQFMRASRDIQEDVRDAYEKLEKLANLVRKKSLFDNRTSEVDNLTVMIKGDIDVIKRKVKDLSGLKGMTARGKDQEELLARNVVLSLESSLRDMSTEFRTVLEKRVENMKFQNDRRKELGESRGNSRPSALRGFQQGSVLLADEKAALVKSASTSSFQSASSSDIAIDMDAALSDRYSQAQLQESDQTDEYLSGRAEAMKTIETTIVELGQLNHQLVTMIQEQQETIQRIDAHVDDAAVNIEAGQLELLKYFRTVSSNRWLMVKLFLVIVFFIVLFVIFL